MRYSVPAKVRALPIAVVGNSPAYSSIPTSTGSASVLPGSISSVFFGSKQQARPTLSVNAKTPFNKAAVHIAAIPGVTSSTRIGVRTARGSSAGPQPGSTSSRIMTTI
jgi:hypothetical protein